MSGSASTTPSCACRYSAGRRPRSRSALLGVAIGPPEQPSCPKPVSSKTMNSTSGAPHAPEPGVGEACVDSTAVRLVTPGNAAPGTYSAIGTSTLPRLPEPSRCRRHPCGPMTERTSPRTDDPCTAPPRRKREHRQRAIPTGCMNRSSQISASGTFPRSRPGLHPRPRGPAPPGHSRSPPATSGWPSRAPPPRRPREGQLSLVALARSRARTRTPRAGHMSASCDTMHTGARHDDSDSSASRTSQGQGG